MGVLGGMGPIWGVAAGVVTLSVIDYWLISDVIKDVPRSVLPRL